MNRFELQSDLIPTDEWELEHLAIQAESLGWLPLNEGAYLHMPAKGPSADTAGEEGYPVITVVGTATDALGLDGPVLLVGW